ncbi:hypothetical protein [Kaistia sp. UC242_56]|uniref:hypothetical protein n=1 Tax=Kaistia sp. UC242_56 TaxID=3374625 RepID=UPI00378A5DE6
MSKTREPHPESFLAFCCWLFEYVDLVDDEWPECLPPPVPLTEIATDDEARARRAALRHEASKKFWTIAIRQSLRDAGANEHELASAVIEKLVNDKVADIHYAASLEFELQRLKLQRRRPQRAVQGWKPSRKVVSEVIAGTHFALGRGKRRVTALALSRGIPTKDRGHGVRPYDIRNAANTVASAMRALGAIETGAWRILALRMRDRVKIADTIWHEIKRSPKYRLMPMYVAIHRLCSSGQLLDRYSELEEHFGNKPIRELEPHDELVIVNGHIEILAMERRRRSAGA